MMASAPALLARIRSAVSAAVVTITIRTDLILASALSSRHSSKAINPRNLRLRDDQIGTAADRLPKGLGAVVGHLDRIMLWRKHRAVQCACVRIAITIKMAGRVAAAGDSCLHATFSMLMSTLPVVRLLVTERPSPVRSA